MPKLVSACLNWCQARDETSLLRQRMPALVSAMMLPDHSRSVSVDYAAHSSLCVCVCVC
jgi:hypothetical protein